MKVYVTRQVPESGLKMLRARGLIVTVSEKDGVLSKSEFVAALKEDTYDAVFCLLTDTIDAEVVAAMPQVKVLANYAVGTNNIDVKAAAAAGILVTNTPDVLTETVAEHTFGLILAITARIAEGDRFTRAGKYTGWAPMLLLGTDLSSKTLGVLGAGRIGSRVAHHAHNGFEMDIIYYDVQRNDLFEKDFNATYFETVDEVLKRADVVTIHVPLLESTKHLIDARHLAMMKPSAYLINSSRGPVINEAELVTALRSKVIRGAALDVFENEPALAPGLAELENVVLTPHIASATEETRAKMSEMAAANIIAALEGKTPPNLVKA